LSAGPDIEVADFRRLADVLAGEGIERIDILGGEPTLHPDLISLIDTACTKGLAVSMSTNGSNVQMLKTLSQNCDRSRLDIGISINNEQTNASLLSYISEYSPLLKSVCTHHRFLPENAARFLDIPGIRYYAIFMDTLRAIDLGKALSFPQFHRALNSLRRRHENLEGVYCSGFLPDIGNYPILESTRCPAGTTKLSIMPDGSVYPCYLFFQCPEFRLGNILSDRFEEIKNNARLNFFRRFNKNTCPDDSCDLSSRCHGGCPAVSLMVSGDLNAPDPRCVR
jgi:radical SAM protein with 4Fe4S-binding SPASM domain